MKSLPRKKPGQSVWEGMKHHSPERWPALLAYAEQRAKQTADLELLRGIRECRAMLETGELPPPDEADESEPRLL
jgi:hypothetical protein